METGGLEDSDFDPQQALKGAREFLKGVSYELAEAQSSPYIMSWGTTSNASNAVPSSSQASSFEYMVRIAYEGPLGFRLYFQGGKCRVLEVIPQSQAQLSGVDIGDIVVAINQLDAPSSLAELKRMTEKRPVTLTMRREVTMNDIPAGPQTQRGEVVDYQQHQVPIAADQQQNQQFQQIQNFRQLQMHQFQQFLMQQQQQQQQQHSSLISMPAMAPTTTPSFQRLQQHIPPHLQQQFAPMHDNDNSNGHTNATTAGAASIMGYAGAPNSNAFLREGDFGRHVIGVDETMSANWRIQGYSPGDLSKRKPLSRHQRGGHGGSSSSSKSRIDVEGNESQHRANMIPDDGEALRRELIVTLSASEDHFVSVRLTGDSLTKVSRGVAALMATWRPTATTVATATDFDMPGFHVVNNFLSSKEASVLQRIFDDAVPNTAIRPDLNCSFRGLLRLISSRASKLVFESFFQKKEHYEGLEVVEMRNHHSSFYDLGLIETSVGFTLDSTSKASEKLFRISPQEHNVASVTSNNNDNNSNMRRQTLRVVAQVFIAQNSPVFKPALVP